MTSVVELISNAIGHKQVQQLGQEALRELSGMYDTVDGRPPPAPSPAAPAPAAAKPEAGGAGPGGKSPGKKVRTQALCVVVVVAVEAVFMDEFKCRTDVVVGELWVMPLVFAVIDETNRVCSDPRLLVRRGMGCGWL